jgi:DNA-binding IclR family transcriptional regulator
MFLTKDRPIRSNDQRIILEMVVRTIRYSSFQPGAVTQLHCGASSKVLMAYLPEQDWDRIIAKEGLPKYTPNTITDADQLKSHLREIRKKGYAYSDQERYQDVRAVAAPVLNTVGHLVVGLSIVGPAYRISMTRLRSLSKLVVNYAQKLSKEVSYVSPAI